MIKYFLLGIVLFCCFCNQLNAQFIRSTLPQYNLNALQINPAYAGSQMTTNFDVNYFGNSNNLQSNYRSTDVSLHGPLALNGSSNLGLNFKFIREGALNEIRFRSGYAFRLDTDAGKFAVGVVFGLNFFDVDEDLATFFYPNFFTFDVGGGLYFHNKFFFAGISALNIFEKLLKDENQIAGLRLVRENPIYAHFGGVIRMNDAIELKPTILAKFSNYYELADIEETISNELGIDFGVSVIIDQDYWVTPFFGKSYFEEVEGFFQTSNPDKSVNFNRFGLSLQYVVGNMRMSYTLHRTAISESGVEFPVSHLFSIGYDFGDENDEFFRYF